MHSVSFIGSITHQVIQIIDLEASVPDDAEHLHDEDTEGCPAKSVPEPLV